MPRKKPLPKKYHRNYVVIHYFLERLMGMANFAEPQRDPKGFDYYALKPPHDLAQSDKQEIEKQLRWLTTMMGENNPFCEEEEDPPLSKNPEQVWKSYYFWLRISGSSERAMGITMGDHAMKKSAVKKALQNHKRARRAKGLPPEPETESGPEPGAGPGPEPLIDDGGIPW